MAEVPFGFTVPFKVALVPPTPVAPRVETVGAAPEVVNERISPNPYFVIPLLGVRLVIAWK